MNLKKLLLLAALCLIPSLSAGQNISIHQIKPNAWYLPFGTDIGAANAYVVNPVPAIASLIFGRSFTATMTHANTGASTINVSGLGVKNIRTILATALTGGEMTTGVTYQFTYDGTEWLLSGAITAGQPAAPGGSLNLGGSYLIPEPNTVAFGQANSIAGGFTILTTPQGASPGFDRQLLNFICAPSSGSGCGGTANTYFSIGFDHDNVGLFSGNVAGFGFEEFVEIFNSLQLSAFGSGSSLEIQPQAPMTGGNGICESLSGNCTPSTNEIFGTDAITGKARATGNHCVSGATPAVCGSAWTGLVALPAGGTTLTVNTTSVLPTSKITLEPIDTAAVGTALSVTCNSTSATLIAGSFISAIVSGTSFTITWGTTPGTNPVCLMFHVED